MELTEVSSSLFPHGKSDWRVRPTARIRTSLRCSAELLDQGLGLEFHAWVKVSGPSGCNIYHQILHFTLQDYTIVYRQAYYITANYNNPTENSDSMVQDTYVSIYIYIYVYMCVYKISGHIYIYIHIYTHIHICVCVCVYIYI